MTTEQRKVRHDECAVCECMIANGSGGWVAIEDYDAEVLKRHQAQHERDCAVEDVKRILTVVGNYVRTKKADMGENVVYWMDLQEIAKHLDVGAHCAHGIPINSPSACPSCHAQQPTRTKEP